MIHTNVPAEDEAIRVVLLTPAGAIRAGLRAMLTADERIQVLAEAAAIDQLDPLPAGCDVIIATAAAAHELDLTQFVDVLPGAGLLVLSADRDLPILAMESSGLHAWGIVSLDADAGAICAAVRAVSEGLLVGSPVFMRSTYQDGRSLAISDDSGETLTPREIEVLQQLALGLTNKQIALALGISEHTAKYHISSIYAKLNVLNRAEAVRVGVRRGWIAV